MTVDLDLIGGVVGTLLTVLILSYLIGDNPLYRLALHVLVGASAGYVVAVAVVTILTHALLPALEGGLAEQERLLIPVLLGIFLLFKGVRRWAVWGNFATAFLIGVGAAVGMAGALLGTIVPQATASGSLVEWLQPGGPGLVNGLLVAVGTACALLAFTFTVRRRRGLGGIWATLVSITGSLGRVFLLTAFGAMFAGALTASLSVLTGRIYALAEGLQDLLRLLGPGG